MAISRMQQPRQNYGLGSFVKKVTGKITKPFTKVAKKLVPKEIAGIMRVAAPFLPPGFREAAYLLGTAKQTGRISPIDLALAAAPTISKMQIGDTGQTIGGKLGSFNMPFAKEGTTVKDFLVGGQKFMGPEGKGAAMDTTGIFGSGGKMFQFGGEQGVMNQIKGFRDQTKLGDFLLGGKEPGTFGMSKIAGIGTGLLSLIQSAKTPEEAGNNLASATGNSADYDEGYEMFSMLNTDAFRIPDQFVLKQNVASGGLMRTNYAMGAGEKGVVNPFIPKPQGPALPDEDKPFRPKPLKPIKMAEFDLLEYQEEFERVFPDMKELRGTDEYNEMLEDYFRGLASKDKEGIMMAEIPRDLDLEKAKEMFIEFNGREPVDMQELLQFFNVKQQAAEGGLMRENFALGSMPTAQESGLGGLPIEADMRYTGGFMPYGAVEKADDVPARLSKNEFVFTADAVRAAGGGSVQKGAKKMYDAMKQLEQQPEAKGAMA